MSKGRRKAELILTDDERQTLKTWASRPKSTQQLAQRARIVLACADGMDKAGRSQTQCHRPDRRQMAQTIP